MGSRDMIDKKISKTRRKIIKSTAVGGGVFGTIKNVPETWTKPVIESVMLPAHAQTTPKQLSEKDINRKNLDYDIV